MIKRTIEISQQPAHLAVRHDQLLIQPHDQPEGGGTSIPCEDIGVVLVDQPRCTYSHTALEKIVATGGVLIVCGRDHLPAGVLLPLADHSQVRWRIREQIRALQRKPLCKRLWRQIVQAKIVAQAANLNPASPEARRLGAMVSEVRSGDPTNVEAQAARRYWSAWAPPIDDGGAFRRDVDGKDPLNAMLNYGYAVMRAAVARALVAAGLLPALGIHHTSRANDFALADDLVEPLRPSVDARARRLYLSGLRDLSRTAKAGLLELLAEPFMLENDRGPLMVQLHRMVASLVHCFDESRKDLAIPEVIGEEGR